MGVEKKGVGTPRVRFTPPIYVVEGRGFGKHAAVFLLHVIYVCGVFSFSIVHPGDTNGD